MKWWVLAVALVAGCATVDRHQTQAAADSRPFAVAPLRIAGVRDQMASRENERLRGTRADIVDLQTRLDRAFDDELGKRVRLDGDAQLLIVPTLTISDVAQFEGLAAEKADASLRVQLIDRAGNLVDDVTLRASADAPLARQRSLEQRLQAAVRGMADRYAERLARAERPTR